jgi:hypothetical protein
VRQLERLFIHDGKKANAKANAWGEVLLALRLAHPHAGLPDFFGTTCQNEKNIPDNHKIYQMVIYLMATKYTKWP